MVPDLSCDFEKKIMHKLNDLMVWHKFIELSVLVYRATEKFPFEERFGLTSQIRKVVVSIVSNIAEGAERNSNNEFIHFLGIGNGSSYELQSQLIISNKLNLISNDELEMLLLKIDEIQKMIYALQKTLGKK